MRKIYFLVLVWSALAHQTLAQESIRSIYEKGQAAYQAKEYGKFLGYMQRLDSLRPQQATILYNLAAAYALNQKPQESLNQLEKALWLNANLAFEKDGDFQALKETKEYQDLEKEVLDLRSSTRNGTDLFRLDEKELHPEGIDLDPLSGTFYVSSVHKGQILAWSPKGETRVFAESEAYLSIMGLKVDVKRARLWACSTPTREMQKTQNEQDHAALLEFDLKSGQLLHRYPAPNKQDWLGDLLINSQGEVLVSNSSAQAPGLLKLDLQSQTLLPLLKAEDLVSLQGLCLDASEERLYFSDYKFGLFVLDLKTQSYRPLKNDTPHPLKGIDGLYFYKNSLLAIHNGLRPFQIVQYQLNEAGDRIVGFRFLEKALPEMDEPTLGAIHQDMFYYIVNSPWGAYDQKKNLILEKVAPPLVRKIDLSNISK